MKFEEVSLKDFKYEHFGISILVSSEEKIKIFFKLKETFISFAD